MHDDNRREFAQMLMVLGDVFGRKVDEPVIGGYWMALEDLDASAVIRAGEQLMRTARRFPPPVDFRNIAGESISNTAGAAWTEVCRLVGNSRSAEHSDPVAEEAVCRLGGWAALGQMTADQFSVWARKDFLEIYRSITERGVGFPESAPDGSSRVLASKDIQELMEGANHAIGQTKTDSH